MKEFAVFVVAFFPVLIILLFWVLLNLSAEHQRNQGTLNQITEEKEKLEKERKEKASTLADLIKLQTSFEKNFLDGRKWLADLIAEHEVAKDQALEECLRYKSRPAITAANEVSRIKKEKKALIKENILLKSELETIKEYFPVVEEYEQANYLVEYTGIQDKKKDKDKGRDLICKEFAGMGDTLIVQAKCWAAKKTIFEKHIFQLFGTVFEYKRKHPGEVVRGVFVTTTKLDDFARECAKELGIDVEENYKLRKDFPMIKCNISSSGEKIYHLPFDQQYDKVKIDKQGEFLALTVKEAEAAGFRRAMRWHGKNN